MIFSHFSTLRRAISEHRLLLGGSLLAASVIALVLGAQFYASREADHAALRREQTVVENGLRDRLKEISRLAVPQTVWDDAVTNLSNEFNTRWATENIGVFLSQTSGFDGAIVLDRDDKVVYGMRDGKDAEPAQSEQLHAAATTLVAKVRAGEAARTDLKGVVARGETLSAPILEGALTLLGNDLFLVSAVLVQPDFGTAMPAHARSAVVVTAYAIDDAFVQSLGQRFLLDHLRLVRDPPALSAILARTGLRDASDRTIATLEWTPPQPGGTLLEDTLPPTLLLVGALCIVALYLHNTARRSREGLIASEARATHLAHHDLLTGLPNRILLDDRVARSLEAGRRNGQLVAVHCIGLDRFKDVNDEFGHQVGDDVIRAVARKISAHCRSADTLARLGGDEFALVQADACAQSAAALADRICKLLAEPIELGAARIFTGCSIGVTLAHAETSNRQELLRQSDIALDRAKDAGRGQVVFFDPDMDASVRMRRTMQEDLRQALAGDQLSLAYQPQVNGRGELFGVEALLRWVHPTKGSISPAVFIPVAEDSHLIDELGMFAMRRAFEDSRRWEKIKIAINVSASQLRARDFVDRVQALAAEVGVSPSRFELEITEGVVLADDPQTHHILHHLRRIGFQIALDDFGTGYSSLSYLSRYPIDKIKIDRSFVRNLGADENSEAVVAAMVRLGRALRLSVLAEGIETEVQRRSLAAAGCTDIQGYLFGKPMPADDITTTLTRREGPAPTQEQAASALADAA